MGVGFVCSPAFFAAIWAIVRCVLYSTAIFVEIPLVNECRNLTTYDSNKWGPYILYSCGEVNSLDNAQVQTTITDDFLFLLILWLLLELILGTCGVLILISGFFDLSLMLTISQICLLVMSYLLILLDFAFLFSIIDRYKGRDEFMAYLLQLVGKYDKGTAEAIMSNHTISSLRDFTSHKLQHLFYRCLSHIITLIFTCCIQWHLIMSCCRG